MSPATVDIDLEFWRALAQHSGVRLVMMVPVSGPATPAWVDAPGTDSELQALEASGRAWLSGAAATKGSRIDEHLAFSTVATGEAGVGGAIVVAKIPGASWRPAERALLDFAADFYSDRLTPLTRRPLPGPAEDWGRRPPRLERWMRSAPERGELTLRYQPEVDMRTGNVVAVEALVRWEHPSRGLLGPESFIAVAEQSDLISVLGNWVIETALHEFASWLRDADPGAGAPARPATQATQVTQVTLRVNVSPNQLTDAATVTLLTHTLERTGLPGHQICIEITENAAPDNALLAQNVAALRHLGVHVALDDFATGYSSLSRLRALPVDTVKIDRSLVTGVDADERAQAIVAAVVGLAAELELLVVAEGVENAQEAATLLRLGCFHAQGHRFGRPMTGDDISALLRAGRVEVSD